IVVVDPVGPDFRQRRDDVKVNLAAEEISPGYDKDLVGKIFLQPALQPEKKLIMSLDLQGLMEEPYEAVALIFSQFLVNHHLKNSPAQLYFLQLFSSKPENQ
ncbi:MAG: hypothetical protein WCE58_12320, partial [Gallionella sp.]